MYSFFLQTLLICVFSKIVKASLSENDTRNLYTDEQHRKDSFSNPSSNERYYISNQDNKTKYIYPNRHKNMYIHHRKQLPIGYDERVFKDRNLAPFIKKRYPTNRYPRNLQRNLSQGLTFSVPVPVPSSNEGLDDLKYPSQLEASHDSPKYNSIFHPGKYANNNAVYRHDGEPQGYENIISEKNLQDSKTKFQNYRAPQPQNVHSFQNPDKPKSHFNKEEVQIMKDLYTDLQPKYRSGSEQDKAGPKNIPEKASKLILQWAENQRNFLDSFVKAITEVLKDHDSSLNTERSIPPRDIMLVKDMLMQLFESITLLREGSTSTRIRTVLSQWIETQKSLIDSFSQAFQNTNQNVDNSASVNEVTDNLIKNLRELTILLRDRENFTATEISSSQPTTKTYLTSTTSGTTHPPVDDSTNRINIIENLIEGLRQMIFQINDKDKNSNTTYSTTESTYTHPTITSYSTTEGTTSHPITNTYKVANRIIDETDSKIKDIFNLIKVLEVLISQLNKKPNITKTITKHLTGESTSSQTTTTTYSSTESTPHPITTTKPKTMTTYSQPTTFNPFPRKSTPSQPTTNNYQVKNHNIGHKFRIMENLIKELNGLINQLSGKTNISSTTHLTGDSMRSQPNDTTYSPTERPSHSVTPNKSTTSTTISQSTISNHSSTESSSSQHNTTLSTAGIITDITTSTNDFQNQINVNGTKILKNLIRRLSDLVDLLNDKNDIKNTPHLTTGSTFYDSNKTTNSTTTTTNAPLTYSTTESTAVHSNTTEITDTTMSTTENTSHFTATTNSSIMIADSESTTPYRSTTEISSSKFNDGENTNWSTKFTAERITTYPIIFNNPTTMTTNIHSTTFNLSITEDTASHLHPSTTLSTTEGSTTSGLTISHSTTNSPTIHKGKIKNIVELLKKLRKILKNVADKSEGKLSPKLISTVKEVLKQIVAGNIDSVNGDSAELEILLSTTVKPNEDITELTMEKLLELLDNFERMYNLLVDGSIQSTTQSTTQNTIFSTKRTTIFSTTQSPTTTSPTQNTTTALTTYTPNTSVTARSATPSSVNNLGSDVSNSLQPIVDAIQQLKMALYHDFYAFKKSQEERMEKILKLLSGKPLDRRTKTIAKPRTIRNKGNRKIQLGYGAINEEKMHHNAVKFNNREKENLGHTKGIPKNSASPKIKKFPLKLSAINVNGGSIHFLTKRRTNKKSRGMHQITPLSTLPHKETYSKRTSFEPETNTIESYKLPILDFFL
ncbi:mucin-3A [Drosophila teissieri]|uniref:mucin-3A n=1 Tax=Drosophila teissieri TaxID=7243 RepID=UPI001CBA59B1|nr:mucin-3A [Drosophila teissieri]